MVETIDIIGAGLAGCTVARKLAEKGYLINIYDRRTTVGGNLFDYKDSYGINIHKFGPHIFHTNNEDVYDFVTQHENWEDFELVCGAVIKDKCVRTIFDFSTIDTFYDKDSAENLKNNLKETFSGRNTVTILELLNSTNPIIKEYGNFLYTNDYEPYTSKQWGISPDKIDKQIFKRVPVQIGYKHGYFDDKYQIMPINGYTRFIENILNHKNIKLELNSNLTDKITFTNDKMILPEELKNHKAIIYTGAIDELFKYKFGHLPYRSLRFELKHENIESYQEYPVVAYPQAKGYTRITEYRKFSNKKVSGTTYAVEYPLPVLENKSVEPYYPILTDESKIIYEKYKTYSKQFENLHFVGRLADFKYYNMDQVIEKALEVANKWK